MLHSSCRSQVALVLAVLCTCGIAGAQDDPLPTTMEGMVREIRALRARVGDLERRVSESEPDALEAEIEKIAGEMKSRSISDPNAGTAGFHGIESNGFFIKSADGRFSLTIGAFSQIRYTVNWRDDAPAGEDDFTRDWSIQRTRIWFSGNYTEDFSYQLRFNIGSSGEVDLDKAWGQWNFAKGWSLRFGRQALAMSREDWASPEDLLGIDFSNNDYTFGLGSSIGGQLHHEGETQRWWFHISDGSYGSTETFGDLNINDVMFGGRWEIQLLGSEWGNWSDLVGAPGRSDGILLGIAGGYQLNEKTSDLPDHAFQAIVDLSFCGDGYQVMVSGTLQWLQRDQTGWEYTGGLLVQGGYFVARDIELYGRYEFISAGDRDGNFDDFNAFALGIIYFPFPETTHWRFTLEGQYLVEAINDTIVSPASGLGWLPSDEKGQWGLRFQIQIGF